MMSKVMGIPIEHSSQILPPSLRDMTGVSRVAYQFKAILSFDGLLKQQHLAHVKSVRR